MRLLKTTSISAAVLMAVHLVVLFAGFFAPYDPEEQNRWFAYAPPTRAHFFDSNHRFHWRPFVYPLRLRPGSFSDYQADLIHPQPLSFFAQGAPYTLLGVIPGNSHLFETSNDARFFLLGTDAYGRDQFSRLLFGGRISLFAGLLGTTIALTLALFLGGMAGFYGHWVDSLIMRTADAFLAIPWLFLLLAVRAILPVRLAPNHVFLLLVAILGSVGWAKPARLIRGVVLSSKQRDYVTAARGFGASDSYLLRKHILPFTASVVCTQAGLLVPQYILAEVTLSFVGLGVSEPQPSWGNMLSGLQQYFVLESCWWMFAPAATLIAVSLAYQRFFAQYAANRAS